MSTEIRIIELKEIVRNNDLNQVIVNCCSDNLEPTTKKINVCNFLTPGIVKERNIDNLTISGAKIQDATITGDKIACNTITSNSLADNSVDNRIICNTDNFTFNKVEVETDAVIECNISLLGNIIMQANCTVDGRDVSADGTKLDQLNLASSSILGNITSTNNLIKNGCLTLKSTGIATSTPVFFGANEEANKTYTVNIPGTELGLIASTVCITSTTGGGVQLPLACATAAGLMSIQDKLKLNGIQDGAQKNIATNLLYIQGAPNTNQQCLSSSTGNCVIIPVATTEHAGLMSSTDFNKLTGIESGAQKNVITCVAGRVGDVILTSNDVGLGNVTNHAQIKKRNTSTIGNIPTWNSGNCLNDGCGVETVELTTNTDTNLVRSDIIKSYIDANVITSNDDNIFNSTVTLLKLPIDVRQRFPESITLPWEPKFVIVYSARSTNPGTLSPLAFQDLAGKSAFLPWDRGPPIAGWLWDWLARVNDTLAISIGLRAEKVTVGGISGIPISPAIKLTIISPDRDTIGTWGTQYPSIRVYVTAYR
jgi:hypothetical protein